MKTIIKFFAIAVFVSAFFSCEQPAEIAPADANNEIHITAPTESAKPATAVVENQHI
ncbi:hypothetical protein [Dyadobacter sp. CY312]|uniref:hypothetical protein n=1 Tax=Dyadobacter sp. CY312 TaxID=2907303 RepID=UPI001F2ACB7E|nr:hypothetical protein [Dyadobacter sp. CY312]MCE7040513.1 hypothetical protein [Dyadobacter sp. CY312]